MSVIYVGVNKIVRDFAAARREKSGSLPRGLLENGQEDTQDNAQDVDEGCWA